MLRSPVIEGSQVWKARKYSRLGRASPGCADDQRPVQALEDRQRVHRAVVVVEPGPFGPFAALPDVGEGAVVLDEAAGVGPPALVGAVHLVRVEDPVRVHRHRRAQLVAEVDDDGVADFGFDQRARDGRRPERRGEVGAVGAVAVGAEGGLPLDRLGHHLVAAGGDDVPVAFLGGDPVFARRPGADQGRQVGGDRLAAVAVRRAHARRHLDLAGQGADVDLPLVGRHLLAGQGAEERHPPEAEEAPAVDRVEAHRAAYFLTTTVSFISVG